MPPLTPALGRRCAIYTRKSFDTPPGQEVTSLESQRAICSSYITSQRHKDWIEVAKPYDDAGKSGANLTRPALQELLADVEAGLVEIVVVYKLDRITRTLLDFVRLIDFFERYGVAFVSITQNFDTSDSMGRLIRNILLTFAQFEREIASDRMRDKKMVMKQRGLWTGGNAPIGYDLKKGRLVINPAEALAVRCIFETYVETQRISATHKRLIAESHRRKTWRTKSGEKKGGGSISLTSLHHVLANPVYIGELTYRGQRHEGIHEPIIEPGLWEAVQAVRKAREQFKPRQPRHLLTGILVDAFGRRMLAHDAHHGLSNSRYYGSAHTAWATRQRIRPVRVRADPIEQLVIEVTKRLLTERTRLRPLLTHAGYHGLQVDALSDAGNAAALRMDRITIIQLSTALKSLIHRVEVTDERALISFRIAALADFITWDGIGLFRATEADLNRPSMMHVEDIPASMTRERRRVWLPITRHIGTATPCPKLTALIEEARDAQALVYRYRSQSLSELAHTLKRKPASFSRLIRLNYLAPDIVASIVDGTQPVDLTRRRLMECDLPMDWSLQRRLFGFPDRPEAWPRDYRKDLAVV